MIAILVSEHKYTVFFPCVHLLFRLKSSLELWLGDILLIFARLKKNSSSAVKPFHITFYFVLCFGGSVRGWSVRYP